MQGFANILKTSTDEWLKKNWSLIVDKYNPANFLKNPEFVKSLENKTLSKLLEILLSVEFVDEFQLIEILGVILHKEFVPTLSAEIQHKLMNFLVEIFFEMSGNSPTIQSIVLQLVDLAIIREEDYILNPKVLTRISSIYQTDHQPQPSYFLQISNTYLKNIFSAFFHLWKKSREPISNPLPFWATLALLIKTGDNPGGEHILLQIIKDAPPTWGYDFSLLLEEVKWIPTFLEKSGVDWKRGLLYEVGSGKELEDDLGFDDDDEEGEDDDFEDFDDEDSPTNVWWQKIQLHFQRRNLND